MYFRPVNLITVPVAVFLFIVVSSSCVVNKVKSQNVQQPSPTPPAEGDWRPSRSAKGTPDSIPDYLTGGLIKLAPSSISEDLVKYREENPSASGKEVAAYGNRLLPLKGYNYWVDIADLVQKKERETTILTDDLQVFPFSMRLTGEKNVGFLLYVPTYDSCCCGYWYTDFPVTKMTGTAISLVSEGKVYTVDRPGEFGQNEVYALVDIKRPSQDIRKWQVPYETVPEGISADGKKIYVEASVDEIYLEISTDGTFKFVDRREVRSTAGEYYSLPQNPDNAYENIMLFKVDGKEYYIKFNGPCT